MTRSLLLFLSFVSFSFQVPTLPYPRFQQDFPSLNQKSPILSILGTPLAHPNPNLSRSPSQVWLKSNLVYGALLWKNKIINALAFTLKNSKKIPKDSQMSKFMQSHFSELYGLHTIPNKEAKKENLGCFAGHLFLYEQGKIIGFENLSKQIQNNCNHTYTPAELESMISPEESDLKGESFLPDFLPSVISAFTWAYSRQMKTPAAAATFLKAYQTEFYNAIKPRFGKVDKGYCVKNPLKSLVEQDFIDPHPNLQLFSQAFNLFCDSFVGSRVPTEIDFDLEASANHESWANCVEAAFTNWLIGTLYNPADHSFGFASFSDPKNEILTQIVKGRDGFDFYIDSGVYTKLYQNKPFIVYNQIKLHQGEKVRVKFINFALGFISVPAEYYNQLPGEEFRFGAHDEFSGKKLFRSPNENNFFILVNGEMGNYYLYEVAPEPINLIMLANLVGFSNQSDNFKSKRDLFDILMSNHSGMQSFFEDYSLLGDCAVSMNDTLLILEFPFGSLTINSNHALFEFKGLNSGIGFELLQQDSFLKSQISPSEAMKTPLDKLLCSLTGKNSFNWMESAMIFGVPLLEFSKKIDPIDYPKGLKSFLVSDIHLWFTSFSNADSRKLFLSSYEFVADYFSESGFKSQGFRSLIAGLSEVEMKMVFLPVFCYCASEANQKEAYKFMLSMKPGLSMALYPLLVENKIELFEEILAGTVLDLIQNYQKDSPKNAITFLLSLFTNLSHDFSKSFCLLQFIWSHCSVQFWTQFTKELKVWTIAHKKIPLSAFAAFALYFHFDLDFLAMLSNEQFDPKFQKYYKQLGITLEEVEECIRYSENNQFLIGLKAAFQQSTVNQ